MGDQRNLINLLKKINKIIFFQKLLEMLGQIHKKNKRFKVWV